MQGASAIQATMQEFRDVPARIFVVWERVLVTDRLLPTTGVLARISDRRASQYWDRGRLVSQKIQEAVAADPNHPFARCCGQSRFVWDAVAVFPKGTRWENQFPAPIFAGTTVVQVAQQFRDALAAQNGAGTDPSASRPSNKGTY